MYPRTRRSSFPAILVAVIVLAFAAVAVGVAFKPSISLTDAKIRAVEQAQRDAGPAFVCWSVTDGTGYQVVCRHR